jgi:hypothetical protein
LQSSHQDSQQSEAEWRHQKVRAEAELEVQRLEIDRIRAELMQVKLLNKVFLQFEL